MDKYWSVMVDKIRKIENLRREAEESEEVDLSKCEDMIEDELKGGSILESLVRVESFLREIIKQGKM